MSEIYELPNEEELFEMAAASGYHVPTQNEFEDFIDRMTHYNYNDTVRDIPNWHNECHKKWSGPDIDKKRMRNEQRYAICAGFHHNNIPVDLCRWVAAFAVPRSKVYSYMPKSERVKPSRQIHLYNPNK